MIAADQPTIFPHGVRVAFSSADDGSIAAGGGLPSRPEHLQQAEVFLRRHHFNPDQRTKIFITYKPENTYTHCERLTVQHTNESVECDAMYTTEMNQVITLPVADCAATVVYDPEVPLLGVLHLGRHSSVAGLIEEFARQVASVGSTPAHWYVWMSPSLQQRSNTLEYFTPPSPDEWLPYQKTDQDGTIHLDIPAHNSAAFQHLGVPADRIQVSQVDTYQDQRYFSHRAATALERPERQGRMMLAAELVQ